MNFMVVLGLPLAGFLAWFLGRSRKGLNLRSVGESSATADAAGINVTAYKYLATVLGGGICGLGGLYIVMNASSGVGGTWVHNCVGGRGGLPSPWSSSPPGVPPAPFSAAWSLARCPSCGFTSTWGFLCRFTASSPILPRNCPDCCQYVEKARESAAQQPGTSIFPGRAVICAAQRPPCWIYAHECA